MLLFWLASASVLCAGSLTCLALGPRRRCDAVTGSMALAIVLAVTLAKILLLAGMFHPVPLTAGAAACLAAAGGWLILDRGARGRAAATLALWPGRPSVRAAPLGWAAAAALAAALGWFGFLAARLPPLAWDALYYHLISVSQWVRTGHLVAPVPGMSSPRTDVLILTQADSFPHDSELAAAWFAVFTRSVHLVQLAQLVFVPMLFSGVYGLSRHLGARARWAILAGAAAVLAPVVLAQVATNYADVAAASALAAAWQFLVAAFPRRPDDLDLRPGPAGPRRHRHLLLAGLCLGLAAGVKAEGLAYGAVAVLLVVMLCIRQTRAVLSNDQLSGDQPRWDLPSPARACAALALPMIAAGSFWYVRTWVRWGSPTWPISVGPFGGRTGLAPWDNVGGLAIPAPWRGSGSLALLARDWAAALPFLRPAGLGAAGTPGLVWLLAGLPAVAALLLSRPARRRHRYALAVVVLPLTLITVASPVGWHARLSIPLLIAGGVAVALRLGSGALQQPARPGGHRRTRYPGGRRRPGQGGWPRRAGVPLAGTAVLALACGQAWNQVSDPSWNVPAGVHGAGAVLALARGPLNVRMNVGTWQTWNAAQARMPAPGAIGFFSQDPPALHPAVRRPGFPPCGGQPRPLPVARARAAADQHDDRRDDGQGRRPLPLPRPRDGPLPGDHGLARGAAARRGHVQPGVTGLRRNRAGTVLRGPGQAPRPVASVFGWTRKGIAVHILRYRRAGSPDARVGVLNDGLVTELTGIPSLGALWSLPLEQIRAKTGNPGGADDALSDVTVLAPVDGRTEVWACGVTYEISREARREESERSADVYERVYDAPRPEIFFKSAAWRVAGDGQPIAVREDSAVNVPEPEVALVVTSGGEIAGYTVCNDVSSRSIEGENPLYLPQAKSYLGACAAGPMIRPSWEVSDPYALSIELTISRAGRAGRAGRAEWTGTASTAQLRRRYDELVRYLMFADAHPEGVVLSTGTCLVPPMPFTLEEGHVVRISVSEIGTLENPVVRGLAAILTRRSRDDRLSSAPSLRSV